MGREEKLVHGQATDTSPWTDRRYQSMDQKAIPVHEQIGDTSPWTKRRHQFMDR